MRARVGLMACLVYLGAAAGCPDSKRRMTSAGGRSRAGATPEQRAGAGGEEVPPSMPVCGVAEPAAPRVFGGVLRVLLEQEPPHLDPLDDPPEPTRDVVSGLIYEPLVECVNGQVRAALAERWEWTADRSSLRLHLRAGVRWHDGGVVSIGDVQASLEAFRRGRSRLSAPAAALADVGAVEGLPDGAVRLRLTRPGPGILSALCDVPIVPAAFALARGKAATLRNRPIGTGPFRFASWDPGKQIRLSRNPSTWRGVPAADEVVFEIEPDSWRALVRARSGEVDLLSPVLPRHYPDQVRKAARAPQVDLLRVRDERYSFLAVNHQHPALADPAVRRALSLLWNRGDLAREVHLGLAQPIVAPFGRLPSAPFEPKEAVRALTDAGWQDQNGDGIRDRAGTALRLGLLHATGPGTLEVEIRRFSTHLQRAGVRLEVTALDPGQVLARLRGRDFDLVPLTWRGRVGEDPAPLLAPAGRFNHGGFRSPRVEALLEQWRAAEDPGAREGVNLRLAQAVADELPAIFLYRHDRLVLVTRRVRGLCSESGRVDLRSAWLESRAVIRPVLLLVAAQGISPGGPVPSPGAGRPETVACACPCSAPPAADSHPFRRPRAEAFDLNRLGRELYRTRRWEEARAKYRAALEADPTFLGPRLNLACAYAQQELFQEAVEEAVALAETAYVPWAREIREARDLAPLQARPERETLEAALASTGRTWGANLEGGVLFVARRSPPVRLPAAGVLYLGLEQEILAWSPTTGTYRQVTAEEGRVLGFVQSPDQRTVVYVRAGRLVREPGRKPRLRGLTLRRLDLATMAVGPEVPLATDVVELQIEPLATGDSVRVRLDTGPAVHSLLFDGRSLSPGAVPTTPGRSVADRLRLTGRGVEQPTTQIHARACGFVAEDIRPPASPPAVRIRAARGQRPFLLQAPLGAGLRGLPFP